MGRFGFVPTPKNKITRRSFRINNKSNTSTYTLSDIHFTPAQRQNEIEKLLLADPKTFRPKYSNNQRAVATDPATGSTKYVQAFLSHFLSNLAVPFDKFGKAAVIELAGNGTMYKFNKYFVQFTQNMNAF
jgi:hypothetical protein